MNLHSPAVTFEPIHRVLFETDAAHWLDAAEGALAAADGHGYAVTLLAGAQRRDILARGSSLGEAIAALDAFCASYMQAHGGRIDYIHGDDEAVDLAAGDGCCGILMPRWKKRSSSRLCSAPARSRKRAFRSDSVRTSAITSSAANSNLICPLLERGSLLAASLFCSVLCCACIGCGRTKEEGDG